MSIERDSQGRTIRRGAYPELTWSAVIVGWFLGSIIAISIGYAALILGFSIEGSELAAIMGWGILRGIMGRTSIVENNINQTIASAVNGASAGMMFSVPALFILASQNPEKYGEVTEFSKVLMVLACITGGILGLAFVIPLRKQMIDFNRLAYPGGIAVASILKSPGAGLRKAVLLVSAAFVSGGAYMLALTFFGEDPKGELGMLVGLPSLLNITFLISVMTIGVGFLSGKGGMVFGYGGFICYFLLAPLMYYYGSDSVVKMFDPPARQAMVQPDNAKHVIKAANALSSSNPDLAHQLIEMTQAQVIFDASKDEAMKKAVNRELSRQQLLDIDQAQLVLKVIIALTELADSVRVEEAEVKEEVQSAVDAKAKKEAKAKAKEKAAEANLLGEIIYNLAEQTRAAKILVAHEFLLAHDPNLIEQVRQQGTAEQIAQIVHNAGSCNANLRSIIFDATWVHDDYYTGVPNGLRSVLFKPTGIGMLIGAAIGGIIAAFPLVRSAIKSMQQAAKNKREGGDESDELSIGLLYAAIVFGAIALIVIAKYSVDEMGIGRAAAMALLGTLWIWIAGVIVSECLGRTNWSPLSGMTLIAVTILILVSSGLSTTATVVSSVMVGAAICVAIAQAGDMMLDLKSGYLVGASPKMQQIGQYLGTWLGPIIVIVLIFVLNKAYGLGSEKLPAPQGEALAGMINGLVGGDVPTWRYLAGGGLGSLLAFSGLGGIGVLIGLGFYMPFATVLTYTIGCVLRIVTENIKGQKFIEDVGIPIAAGLIVGEALVGVGNALYQIAKAGF